MIILVIPAVVAMMLVSIAPAFAQDPAAEWQVTLSPYLMGASMGGTTTLRGHEVVTDLSASDIFSNLQFGAMGYVVARKGAWAWAATRSGCRSAPRAIARRAPWT